MGGGWGEEMRVREREVGVVVVEVVCSSFCGGDVGVISRHLFQQVVCSCYCCYYCRYLCSIHFFLGG